MKLVTTLTTERPKFDAVMSFYYNGFLRVRGK
jgi:hypothetical protein